MSKLPEDVIATAHHWLILHGRYVCKARNPQCDKCFLKDLCRAYPRLQRDRERKAALTEAQKKLK